MENVTDRTSNPFGMDPSCDTAPEESSVVYGYGDANADFHLIGDCPAVHGGVKSGIPFTDSDAGARLLSVFEEAGFVESGDQSDPRVSNLFSSYLHMCSLPNNQQPSKEQYDRLEPFFDAELRAIAAHVLLPVGERATRHVFENYTARPADGPLDMDVLHASELRGSGWLVVPIAEPADWDNDQQEALLSRLQALLASDYRQISELGRFIATDEQYFVR
ncbi:uracil-DNA glycosylase family protein [Natranaeroarchaeum sulfidigenes]|uniref:Uracil-DNA glycosylase n=1 Tax=Natranaeroarchaeum sulfidigenes TaxID=2784880 RepID=A0A897MWV6_9EURY|nr:uracil-DNA glycosylase family protein [Natranaeroarchaeum sulfidigenes]QSG02646.1 Uracil-DNA glycosylase [Natranaeroarchaeum sulfidigenes]